MERLTYRINGKVNTNPHRKKEVREKLAKIEDLEEEMGIDVVEFLTHYKETGVIKW